MRTNHVQTDSGGAAAAGRQRAALAPAHGAAVRMAPAADRLEALGLLIHGLSKTWREEMDRRLRPLGLTRVQWQALLWLSRAGGALSQRELSDLLEIGAPATVALVDRMERDGLVARSAVPGDRRRNAVALTSKARRTLKTIHAAAGQLRREVLHGLSREEIDTLCALLDKAKRRIQELRSAHAPALAADTVALRSEGRSSRRRSIRRRS
jgi:MarR family transcriptional regulator for hemolysin